MAGHDAPICLRWPLARRTHRLSITARTTYAGSRGVHPGLRAGISGVVIVAAASVVGVLALEGMFAEDVTLPAPVARALR